MVMDIQWNQAWISYHNQLTIFLIKGNLILNQFHLLLHWKRGIPIDQCTSQQAFWFCRGRDRRFPYQWYNVLWRSCWQHLPFLRWAILGGTIVCRYQFWLRQWQLVLSLRRHILVHVYQHQSLRRRYWRHHHHLQWSYLMAFNRQVGYRALSRTIPSRHYLLRYQLDLREWK